jgi:AbiV family abortive infection protein
MTVKEFEALRKACLANAKSFIDACKKLDNRNTKHIKYHLAALALEEVGKIEMVAMQRMASKKDPSAEELNLGVDDHERKLFWAFWGASFARNPITQKQIDEQKGLAKAIHIKRLSTLYVDVLKPTSPGKIIANSELENIISLAEARYGMAKYAGISREDSELTEHEKTVINWFMAASNDKDERKYIFGGASNAKLAELGNAKKWINWLYEEAEKRRKEGTDLLQDELKRQEPSKEEASKPKWKVRIKIRSHSHSIRPKPLNKWNDGSDWIKLYPTKDKNELIMDFILTQSVPLVGLWNAGWDISKLFVVSLNTATSGYFWWNVPRDVSKYYEQIDDLERSGYAVAPQISPTLDFNWKDQHMVLDNAALGVVARNYAYIMKEVFPHKKRKAALGQYANGLALLAKNDVHLRFETNIWQEFWFGLKKTVLAYGDSQKDEGTLDVLKRQFGEEFHELLDEFATLELKLAATPSMPLKDITLEEVYKAKILFDFYIGLKAKDWAKSKVSKK